MADQIATSILEGRNVKFVDNGDGTRSLAVSSNGVASEVDANLFVDGAAVSASNPVPAGMYSSDGSTWEPYKSNREFTLIPSAAYGDDQYSTTQTNTNSVGVVLFINITLNASNVSLTPNIYGRDPVSLLWVPLTNNMTAVTAANFYAMVVHPSITQMGGYSAYMQTALPRTWRIFVDHSVVNAVTYSIGGAYLL